MVTRFCVGSNRPTERLNLHVSSISLLPKSYNVVFNDSNWQNAMKDEYDAFIKNNTWTLMPQPTDAHILEGIDVDETFSPDVKPGIIRIVLSLAIFDIGLLVISMSIMLSYMGTDTAYLLLYVDDIVLIASSEILLQRIITSLLQEFSMTDLGSLNYFLGIFVTRYSSRMFLSQRKYAAEIIDRVHMVNCNPCQTLVDTESKLGYDDDLASDPTLYQSLSGSLQYLTFTCPGISYAVQQVCLHMHDPRGPRFSALKRILTYVQGSLDHELQLFSSSTTNLVAYSDSDWAGCPTTRRSTSVYYAKYRSVAETCWLRNLLRELYTPLSSAMLVYCDNVRVLHVPSRYQYEHIFTKGLPSALFEEFYTSLSARCPPAPTAGECYPYNPIHCIDCYEMMSNDEYKSVEHRVLANPEEGARVSIVVFLNPSIREKLYGPFPELISAEKPTVYNEFTYSDYMRRTGSIALTEFMMQLRVNDDKTDTEND
ncbi:ribonuclease H-like domain-containing protein [Tanacetum coccineum]